MVEGFKNKFDRQLADRRTRRLFTKLWHQARMEADQALRAYCAGKATRAELDTARVWRDKCSRFWGNWRRLTENIEE